MKNNKLYKIKIYNKNKKYLIYWNDNLNKIILYYYINKLIDDGYYKLKMKDDSIVDSIEYIGLELNIDKFDNVLENEIGVLDGYEYINYKKN